MNPSQVRRAHRTRATKGTVVLGWILFWLVLAGPAHAVLIVVWRKCARAIERGRLVPPEREIIAAANAAMPWALLLATIAAWVYIGFLS
jgi:hypothetical protein